MNAVWVNYFIWIFSAHSHAEIWIYLSRHNHMVECILEEVNANPNGAWRQTSANPWNETRKNIPYGHALTSNAWVHCEISTWCKSNSALNSCIARRKQIKCRNAKLQYLFRQYSLHSGVKQCTLLNKQLSNLRLEGTIHSTRRWNTVSINVKATTAGNTW